jgi:hypothetical protein
MSNQKKKNPNDIWKEGQELAGEKNQDVIRLHERRIANLNKKGALLGTSTAHRYQLSLNIIYFWLSLLSIAKI